MSNPNQLSRRKALKRLGSSGVALALLSTPVAGGSAFNDPDEPSTNADDQAPGGGGSAAETDANAATSTVNVSGCKSYESRVSLGVHYYGSIASDATDEWFHEFCVSGSSFAREEPLECGDLMDLHAIDYQKLRLENNNSGDTFLTSEFPDPVYRGVTPTPPGSSVSIPGYSDTVETVLKTAISYQYPAAAYAMTAEELATSVYNDLLRTGDANQTEPNVLEKKWSYTGSSNPNFPPADANNYFRFLVSSENSYFVDVTAEQQIDGPPLNTPGALSTSLRFSTDLENNSVSTDSGSSLTEGMTTQEVASAFSSEKVDPSELSENSPIRERVGSENLVRVNLPLKFEDPNEEESKSGRRQKN